MTSNDITRIMAGLDSAEVGHVLKWAIVKADLDQEAQNNLLKAIENQVNIYKGRKL